MPAHITLEAAFSRPRLQNLRSPSSSTARDATAAHCLKNTL